MNIPASAMPWQQKWLKRIALWACQRLPAQAVGNLFEELQVAAAGKDPRIGVYALEYNNPQALCFVIDAYPTLQRLFSEYPRMGEIRLLDIGPAFGAAGGLLAQMHRSHFLGPRLKVDALDVVRDRQAFIEMSYPLVRFLHARIEDLPREQAWDIAFCSNVIEHLEAPRTFLQQLLERVRGHVVLLAPYSEAPPLSPGHLVQITQDTFEGLPVQSFETLSTTAWPTTSDGILRQQALVVLKGIG